MVPSNELERLAALASYEIDETSQEEVFDDIANLAARIAGTAYAAITLLHSDLAWLKAATGVPPGPLPRSDAFCSTTILTPNQPLVVGDLVADPRFVHNPLVEGGPFRAYLGIPLVDPNGFALGSLCVLDDKARTFDTATVETLTTLARAVVTTFELRRALKQADGVARTDHLTGLSNRRTAMEAIKILSKAATPFAVIAVDLDFFKETNDRAGHAAGDAVLRAAAERMRGCARKQDTVARLGGDEFVVLLTGVDDPETAHAAAERISTSLHMPVEFDQRQHRMGATIGLALYPRDAAQGDRVFRLADEALIQAKREKRGSIGMAVREDAAKLATGVAILHAFGAGLDERSADSAIIHFDPVICLSTENTPPTIIALEALTRWDFPEIGPLWPADLLPIIGPERSTRLGQMVRARALAIFKALRDGGLADARLALNFSATEVVRAETAASLANQVERAGLSLSDIDIELTEEILLERVSGRTLEEFAALQNGGAHLVLDGFGIGASSLAQFLRLPLDGLKLDKTLVQLLGIDRRADGIVRATLSLAQSIGCEVVADGVATDRQATILRQFGCKAAQGPLFAQPMTEAEVLAWIRRRVTRALPEPSGLVLQTH